MTAKAAPVAISFGQATDFAWATFRRRFGLFTATLLAMVGAWVVLEILVVAGQRLGILFWATAHLAFLFVLAQLEIRMLRICIDLFDAGEPRFVDLIGHRELAPKFLLGQVLLALAVLAGSVLLVVPGVYIAARYGLFGLSMADGETSLARALQTSSDLSSGVRFRLAGILLALAVFNALGAAFLGLGLLLTIPLSTLTMTAVYRQLKSEEASRRLT